MRKIATCAAILIGFTAAAAAPAAGQSVSRVYTTFDSDKCRHTKGTEPEDYGSWRCKGYAGIDVVLSAGDQRMYVSFGRNARDEVAAGETFPGFNSAYKGTVEWRIETLPNGKTRPFAAILGWTVRIAGDEDRPGSTGRVLVVTRLNPGGVCHVGYVNARTNRNANELAQQLADAKARGFKCGVDKPSWVGHSPL